MKQLSFFLLVVIASLAGFIVHVIAVEWLPSWIGSQMQGVELKPSWAVRYIAGMTSVEYGFAILILYHFSRDKLLSYGKFKASMFLSALLLALQALLIRQPLMDYLIGNPLHVVIVQNGFIWLSWIILSFITVYGYEFIQAKFKC